MNQARSAYKLLNPYVDMTERFYGKSVGYDRWEKTIEVCPGVVIPKIEPVIEEVLSVYFSDFELWLDEYVDDDGVIDESWVDPIIVGDPKPIEDDCISISTIESSNELPVHYRQVGDNVRPDERIVHWLVDVIELKELNINHLLVIPIHCGAVVRKNG